MITEGSVSARYPYAKKLVSEKGKQGSIIYCDKMSEDYRTRINNLPYFDQGMVEDLHAKMDEWNQIKLIIIQL